MHIRLKLEMNYFSMYGFVPRKFQPSMVLELCEMGDLLHYLTENESKFQVILAVFIIIGHLLGIESKSQGVGFVGLASR